MRSIDDGKLEMLKKDRLRARILTVKEVKKMWLRLAEPALNIDIEITGNYAVLATQEHIKGKLHLRINFGMELSEIH